MSQDSVLLLLCQINSSLPADNRMLILALACLIAGTIEGCTSTKRAAGFLSSPIGLPPSAMPEPPWCRGVDELSSAAAMSS